MKKLIFLLLILLSISILGSEIKEIKIGTIYDGKDNNLNYVNNLMKTEIQNIVGSDYKVLFPEDKQLVDGFNREEIEKKLDDLLNDEEIDLVIASGFLSSYVATLKKKVNKPLFAPFVCMDILEEKFNESGIENLNYLSSSISIEEELKNMKKIVNFKKLTILLGEDIINVIPNIYKIYEKNMKKYNLEFEYEYINVSNDLDSLYEKLENAEAIAIGPIRILDEEKRKKLYDYINNKKIPSFSLFGMVDVKDGLLAGYSYEKDTKKRIRTMAVNISRSLTGEKIKDLPTNTGESKPEILLNMEVVEKTGLWLDWDVISSSKLINFIKEDDKNAMDLLDVIEITLKNNLELKAMKESLKITDLELKKAVSDYKPSLKASLAGLQFDENRAKSVSVPYSETTVDADINLTQVIFSNDINMNIEIKKNSIEISKEKLRQKEYDLILETTEGYFNILKAKAYAKIQNNKLELTKTNLNIAKSRKAAGISGSADIYRWESELANSVSGLIEAMFGVTIAKANLKRILNYEIYENINIKTMDYKNNKFLTSDPSIMRFIENRKNLDKLIKHLTYLAYKNSPDLKILDLAIETQKDIYKKRKLKRFMPTVALSANYKFNDLVKEGKGKDNPTPYEGDTEWSIGLGVEIPLYTGGKTRNDIKISETDIKSYEYKKEALKKGIEQQIITYISQAVSNFAKIRNAKVSSESANKALDLVSDAYFKGIVSMTELMDAQTAAISASEYKETVVYDFIVSLIKTERSVGIFYFMKDEEGKKESIEAFKGL